MSRAGDIGGSGDPGAVHHYTCVTSLVADYYEILDDPSKDFYVFGHSARSPCSECHSKRDASCRRNSSGLQPGRRAGATGPGSPEHLRQPRSRVTEPALAPGLQAGRDRAISIGVWPETFE